MKSVFLSKPNRAPLESLSEQRELRDFYIPPKPEFIEGAGGTLDYPYFPFTALLYCEVYFIALLAPRHRVDFVYSWA